MTPAQQQTVQWLANGETGGSSKTMAYLLAFDVEYQDGNPPYDPADFDRCLGFLEMVPEARPHIPKMAGVSVCWARIAERWDEIEASHLAEVGLHWCKAKSAPKTYALMKQILRDTDLEG